MEEVWLVLSFGGDLVGVGCGLVIVMWLMFVLLVVLVWQLWVSLFVIWW